MYFSVGWTVYICDENKKKSIVRLFCDVVRRGWGSFTILLLDLRSDAHDSFQFDRRRELWSRSRNLWMSLPNAAAKLPTAGCADPTRLQPLSVWQDRVTINVTTRDTWNLLRNWGLSQPVVHLIRRLITDVGVAWSRGTFLTSVFSTSFLLAVIFISLHICTGSFIVKRNGLPRGRSPICRCFCHFIVYTSRRLYAIPPFRVCNHTVLVDQGWRLCNDKSRLQCLFTFQNAYFH